eukprot:2969644-Pleurochrysis_carterae.AAC.13
MHAQLRGEVRPRERRDEAEEVDQREGEQEEAAYKGREQVDGACQEDRLRSRKQQSERRSPRTSPGNASHDASLAESGPLYIRSRLRESGYCKGKRRRFGPNIWAWEQKRLVEWTRDPRLWCDLLIWPCNVATFVRTACAAYATGMRPARTRLREEPGESERAQRLPVRADWHEEGERCPRRVARECLRRRPTANQVWPALQEYSRSDWKEGSGQLCELAVQWTL